MDRPYHVQYNLKGYVLLWSTTCPQYTSIGYFYMQGTVQALQTKPEKSPQGRINAQRKPLIYQR